MTNPNSISRKDFIKSSSILLASTCLLSAEQAIADESVAPFSGKTLTLKNVRLETGFEYDQDEVVKTKT